MIGWMRGTIVLKTPPSLVVEVAGLGYELEAPMSTYFGLPAIGETVQLFTHLVVREDAQLLYGFATEEERGLFRNLLKVSGIGPKIALALLSGISVSAFAQCIYNEDVAALTRVPGIGRKTAERLLLEMKDRLQSPTANGEVAPAGLATAENEAFGALLALGYKAAEATRLLKSVSDDAQSTEELIRQALQNAARE